MRRAITVSLFLLLAWTLAAAEPYTYTGVNVCSMCHRGQNGHLVFEKWLQSKHASAFKSLDPAKGEDQNPACLACHTTGFKAGGYEVGSPTAAKFEGVQCEACHGPGSAYKALSLMKDRKLALANGLTIPSEETCKKCHQGKCAMDQKGFHYADALKKIDHNYHPSK